MSMRSGAKVTLRVVAAVIGLAIALALLAPIVFIGDPGAQSDQMRRTVTVWVSLLASWAVGSAATSAVLQLLLRNPSRSRRWVVVGSCLTAFSIALFVLAYVWVRSPLLLSSAPISLVAAYVGGGLILTGAMASKTAASAPSPR